MSYMARNVPVRLDPRRLLDGARSVVMVADQYWTREDARDEPTPAGHGRIARYARGRDYHAVIKRRLHALCDDLRRRYPGNALRAFVDTAPVMERELAQRAGLGWIGKHTLLIHPRLGSYVFLGGFVTTLDLEPTPEEQRIEDHCGSCTRCIDACPTGAIGPYTVNASRCISYLTIENKDRTPGRFFGAIDDWVFGCDVCQEVCPHNSPRTDRVDVGAARGEYHPGRSTMDLLDVLGWRREDRQEAFRGSSMKRAGLGMIKRNAVIAAANAIKSGRAPELLPHVQRVADDEDETDLARQTARDVLASIEPAS